MGKITEQVGEYLRYCEKVRGMSETTMRQKRHVLLRFVTVTGVAGVEELTNEVFNEWVEHEVRRGVKAESVNAYNSIVVAFVRYYRETGMKVPLNLALVARLKTVGGKRRFYSAEEVALVVETADEVTGLQIRILFETGMRIAELTRLRVSDFEGRRVRFIGKGRKMREVYVTAETLDLVRRHVARYGIKEYMWAGYDGVHSLNGEPPTVNTVRIRLRRAFERAGFEGFYPHALRHSFATDLQLKGASVSEIKEMIGHSSVATTERYLHGFEGRMQELFDKYW